MDLINISQCNYDFFNIKIHQPTLSELSEIFKEEEDLIFILKFFMSDLSSYFNTIDSEKPLNEFELLLGLLTIDTGQMGLTIEKKKKLLQFISLCFEGYEYTISNTSFIFNNKNNKDDFFILDNSNFAEFKKILKTMFDIPEIFGKQEEKYNPKNARAARIAKALEEGNKKVAEINNTQNKKGIIENYITILSIGLKIPPAVLCKQLSLYNLFSVYKRFVAKVGWDLDIDCRLAGASPKDSPENWMSLN